MSKKSTVRILILLGCMILVAYISGIGCPIKFVTGISCPGCGMTRALLACVELDFAQAFYYHPVFWMAPAVVIIMVIYDNINRTIRNILLYSMIFLLLAVYIFRLISEGDIVTIDIGSGFIYRLIKDIVS